MTHHSTGQHFTLEVFYDTNFTLKVKSVSGIFFKFKVLINDISFFMRFSLFLKSLYYLDIVECINNLANLCLSTCLN